MNKTKIFYSDKYTSAAHAFDTTRKSALIADFLRSEYSAEIDIVEPESLNELELMQVHSQQYVDAVRTGEPRHLASSNGFQWCPNIYDAVCSSNGGVLEACQTAFRDGISGSLSSGLHHAHVEHGGGFCTFNGLAVAARLMSGGTDRVLIVDYDAHFGDGTTEIIKSRKMFNVNMIDVSTSDFPHNRDSGLQYLTRCCSALFDTPFDLSAYSLVIYNAGVDPYEGCRIGGLQGVTAGVLAERDRFVFDECGKRGVPVAFCLAGGYSGPQLSNDKLTVMHATTCVLAHDARVKHWS